MQQQWWYVFVFLLTPALVGAQGLPVIPQLPDEPDVAGTWRVLGQDRMGAYVDLVDIERDEDGYTYQRRPADEPRARREVGRVVADERWLSTFEDPEENTGLTKVLRSTDELLVPFLREGRYRVESPTQANGFSHFPGTYRMGRERLVRITDPLDPSGRSGDVENNHVELLVDGKEFFPQLREALEGAQRSICLQTFIFTEDSTGRWVARLLMDKAREGVEVRLLCDNVNTRISRGMRRDLRAAGVELIVQHTWMKGIGGSFKNVGSRLWGGIKRLFGGKKKPREERGLFNHDHRKITVVDGRVAFIGGMNIAQEYESEWHDVHSRVEGEAVGELSELFFDRWRAAGGVGEAPAPDPVVLDPSYWPGDLDVDVLETLPGLKKEIRDRYLAEIHEARDRVWIECAYFLDDRIIRALQAKVRQGVDSVVIIPNDEKHDVKLVRDAFHWVQNDVVHSGIRLYKYQGPMVHSKVAAFDGRTCTVGSSNLDNMALEHLAEANIFVNDPGFTRTMEQRIFAVDIPRSEIARVRELSWWEKLKSGVLHFFRTLL